jgi:hypothetical protein
MYCNDTTTTAGQTDRAEPQNHSPAPTPTIASNCSHGGEQVLTATTRRQRNDKGAPETLMSLGPYVGFFFQFIFLFVFTNEHF